MVVISTIHCSYGCLKVLEFDVDKIKPLRLHHFVSLKLLKQYFPLLDKIHVGEQDVILALIRSFVVNIMRKDDCM